MQWKVFPWTLGPPEAVLLPVSFNHQLKKSRIHCFVKAYGRGLKETIKEYLLFERTLISVQYKQNDSFLDDITKFTFNTAKCLSVYCYLTQYIFCKTFPFLRKIIANNNRSPVYVVYLEPVLSTSL